MSRPKPALALFFGLLIGACADVRVVGERVVGDGFRVIGGTDANVFGSALDAEGNVYLVGSFNGRLEFASTTLEAPGTGAAFVLSLDPRGGHRWSHAWVSTNFVTAADVLVDGERVRVTGYVSGATDAPIAFDGGRRQSAVTFDFARVDGTPAASAFAYASPSGNVQSKAIVRSGGRQALVGHFVGEVDLGGGPLPPSPVGVDSGFVGVFDDEGMHLWSSVVEGANVELSRAAFAATGSPRVGGWFARGAVFGSAPARGRDGLFVAFDRDGAVERTLVIATDGNDEVSAIASRPSGGEVVVGSYTGELDVADRRLDHAGGGDAFVIALDGDGSVAWVRSLSTGGADRGRRLAVRPDGTVLVAGTFGGSLTFGEETRVAEGESDVFLAAFSAEGDALWIRRFGGAGRDTIGAFELGEDDAVLSLFVDGEVEDADGELRTGPLALVRVAL